MPFDFYVNTDGELEYDNFGDYETVRGNDNVRQQIRLAIQRGLGITEVTQLTQQKKRTFRRDIRDALSACPYVDDIVSIKLRTPSDEEVHIDVQTRSDDLSVTLER